MNETLPRREAVLELLTSRARPLTVREMAVRLGVSAPALPGFSRYVESLAQQGELELLPPERFALPGPQGPRSSRHRREREGLFDVDERRGALVLCADVALLVEGREGGAQRGDRVRARPTRGGPLGPEGEVVSVIERAPQRASGVLRRRGQSAWVDPDDPRWRGPIVLKGDLSGKDGDGAVVEITRRAELPGEHPEGRLIAAFSGPEPLLTEEEKLLVREQIEHRFPRELALDPAGDEPAIDALAEGLADRTGIPFIAVDEGDGDLELAFWIERTPDGAEVWVAVADVEHHVAEGSPLDRAALERGRKVRLPQSAAPMLPPWVVERGALRPGQPRRAVCWKLALGPGGEALGASVELAVVQARGRVTAAGAARALGWSEDVGRPPPGYPLEDELMPGLRRAAQVAHALRERRLERGAVELPEASFGVALRNGRLQRVTRTDETGEARAAAALGELALAVDEAHSRHLAERGVSAIYWVQAPPAGENFEPFSRFCEGLGFPLEEGDSAALAALAQRLGQLPQRDALAALLRASIEAPTHDAEAREHWALAARAHTRATAPLRRYPDLVAQRLLKRSLRREAEGGAYVQSQGDEALLREAAGAAARAERRAERAEREAIEIYRAAIARELVGEEREGQVIAVGPAGARVLLEEPPVEVLVRPSAMGREGHALSDERPAFVAKKPGDSVGLGDALVVRIDEASPQRRLVVASRVLPEAPLPAQPRGRKKSATGGKRGR